MGSERGHWDQSQGRLISDCNARLRWRGAAARKVSGIILITVSMSH